MSGGGGSHRSRRPQHEEHEEHENHERWLVTYADMLTLLMVLFIVLFAMSQVDQKKYNALKNGLADGFGSTSSFMKGSDSILEGDLKEASDPQLDGTKIFADMTEQEQQAVTQTVLASEAAKTSKAYEEASKAAQTLLDVKARLQRQLHARGLDDDVAMTIDDRGLVVSLISRHVVFEPNIAQLSPRGMAVVDALAPVLRTLPNDLRVDGHTNQAAGRPKYYATDWDLSAARALSVLRRLQEADHIPGTRLSLAAYGHERPLRDPDTEGSQAINKRVDIVVLPDLDPTSQDLLDDVMEARPESTTDSSTDDSTDDSTDTTHADEANSAAGEATATEEGETP